MNYQNIVNGEKRIFPYYKGVFLGFTDFGYANKKSAQKFMSPIPPADIYERFGGEEQYKRTHGYLYGLVTKEPYAFYKVEEDFCIEMMCIILILVVRFF